MLAYLMIPILIIIGLCFFFYKVGEYAGKIKRHEKAEKSADQAQLEEENKKLKSLIEDKDRELESQDKLIETTLKKNSELLAKSRKEFAHRADGQRNEVLDAIKFKSRISQLEAELLKNRVAIPPPSFSSPPKVERKTPKFPL